MKKSELNKMLFSNYGAIFKPHGFKRAKYGFMKISGDYCYNFGFSSINRDNSFPTTFYYTLHSKSVGEVLKRVINIRAEPFFHVNGMGQKALWEEKKYSVKDYDIYTEADAKKMVQEVSTYFFEIGLPYLVSISSRQILESLINKTPHPKNFRSGLVLAKLVDNPQYDLLVDQYRAGFNGWAVEWDKTDFEKLVTFLAGHSPEQLQTLAEG